MTTTYGSIPLLLMHNPNVTNRALAGVIEANLVGFEGRIEVAAKIHRFATGDKDSRIIYVSPYGSFVDFVVNVKRFLAGVQFESLTNNGAHITSYVLGVLQFHTDEYREAQAETKKAFEQGRRFTIAIPNNCSDLSIELDDDKGACQLF